MKVYQRKERYRKIGGEATHREILFEGGLLLIEFSHLNRWCTSSASGTNLSARLGIPMGYKAPVQI